MRKRRFSDRDFFPAVLCVALGCGGGDKKETGPGTTNPGALPADMGYCETTCTKDCSNDQDCNTSGGELCCDLGAAGKTCMKASLCPRFCADDAKCDSTKGQACMRVTLSLPQNICTDPGDGLRLCAADNDCKTAGEVCCTNYKEPICLPANECPKACAQSSECDTGRSEVCCTTVKIMEPSLNVSGLCLNTKEFPCLTACSQSAECDTASGELCCRGVCSTSCPKTCKQSSDCSGEICCKSALMRMPSQTLIFPVSRSSGSGGMGGTGGKGGAGGAGGSGGSTGTTVESSLCYELIAAWCDKFFLCDSTTALSVYASAADCRTEAAIICDSAFCDSGKTFSSTFARSCISQIKAASCANYSSSDMTAYAPDCDSVCL